jgi:hypothetical protein
MLQIVSAHLMTVMSLLGGGLPSQEIYQEQVTRKLTQVTYPVADLVVPIDYGWTKCDQDKPKQTTEDKLIRLITATIVPDQWAEAGGKSTVQYYPLGLGIVVNAPQDIQEQVFDLLQALRRLQELQVVVDIRLVSVSEATLESMSQQHPVFRLDELTREPGGKSVQTLNDMQVLQWMQLVQGDPRSNVCQHPRMTLFNGQKATVEVTDRQYYATGVKAVPVEGGIDLVQHLKEVKIGVEFSVCPVASADRRSVRLEMSGVLSNLDNNVPVTTQQVPFTRPCNDVGDRPKHEALQAFLNHDPDHYGCETKYAWQSVKVFSQTPSVRKIEFQSNFSVPTGQTALFLAGKSLTEARSEYGPPVLSKIPYVSRLFTNVGYGREVQYLFVMATPRLIVSEEEEPMPVPPANNADQVQQEQIQLGGVTPRVIVTEEEELILQSEPTPMPRRAEVPSCPHNSPLQDCLFRPNLQAPSIPTLPQALPPSSEVQEVSPQETATQFGVEALPQRSVEGSALRQADRDMSSRYRFEEVQKRAGW